MSTKQQRRRIMEALRRQPRGRGRRFSPELRVLIGRYARQRCDQGASQLAVATELGVDERTVARALKECPQGSESALLPVRVVPRPSASPVATVRAPGGLVIEGLDLDSIASLIRVLSC